MRGADAVASYNLEEGCKMLRELKARVLAARNRIRLRLQLARSLRKPAVERREGIRLGIFAVPERTPEWEQVITSMSHIFLGHGYTPHVVTEIEQACMPHELLHPLAFQEEHVNAMSWLIIDAKMQTLEIRRLKTWAIDMGMNVIILTPEALPSVLDQDNQKEYQLELKSGQLSSKARGQKEDWGTTRLHRVQYSDTGDAIRKMNAVVLNTLKAIHGQRASKSA